MQTGSMAPVASVPEIGAAPQFDEAAKLEVSRHTSLASNPLKLTQGRLVIEKDPSGDAWVYKTVDSRTGEVLAQYPLKSAWEMIRSRRSGLGLVVDQRI